MKTVLRTHQQSALRQQRERGFTLVEALIAMTIVALLLAVGLPNLSNFTAGRAVRAQVESLANAMRLARTEAVKRGTRVSVCPATYPGINPACVGGTAWEAGWIIFTDRGAVNTIDGTDQVIRVQTGFPNSGGITSAGGSSVNFFPNGVAIGGQRQFTFSAQVSNPTALADLSRRMCLSNVGSTRVIKSSEVC